MGQLVDWDGTQDALVGQCQRCHAPLAEQHPRLEGAANPDYLPETRAHGVSCAVCHVRQWTRYGPPAPVPENAPHGGFVGREEFQDPVFCSPCHDFEAGRTEREGKLLQETGPEWQRTPQAAAGQTCQTCHMPEGRHLWRGVHDPETVKQSVHVEADFSEQSGRLVGALRVQNVGAAHRLPTYTTPQLTLIVEQVDAAGAPLPDTRAEGAIARRLTPDLKTELFDTRLLPGEVHALDYDQPRAAGAVALVARLECWPDEAYRRFYEIKLRTPEKHPTGEAMLRAALQASIDSRFVVWEQVQPL